MKRVDKKLVKKIEALTRDLNYSEYCTFCKENGLDIVIMLAPNREYKNSEITEYVSELEKNNVTANAIIVYNAEIEEDARYALYDDLTAYTENEVLAKIEEGAELYARDFICKTDKAENSVICILRLETI